MLKAHLLQEQEDRDHGDWPGTQVPRTPMKSAFFRETRTWQKYSATEQINERAVIDTAVITVLMKGRPMLTVLDASCNCRGGLVRFPSGIAEDIRSLEGRREHQTNGAAMPKAYMSNRLRESLGTFLPFIPAPNFFLPTSLRHRRSPALDFRHKVATK